MKKLVILMVLLSNLTAQAQGINDGPYVFYKQDQAILKRVENGMAKETPLNNGKVDVLFAENTGWNFSVDLHPVIDVEPCESQDSGQILFISDIEGEFAGFRSLLIANGIMDEKYNWTFAKGRMVICGDLFDRGNQVTETIWLIYKLEQGAKAAGGNVHTILGNHDIMNLSGDLRYVQPKYFESAKLLGLDYMRLYDTNTALGRWLRSKNVIEKIGDNLCVHAGIAPQINSLGLTLKEINDRCRPYYDKASVDVKAAGDSVSVFFSGVTSPFWYRGYFHEPKATEVEVDETLRVFGVSRIVVGHTIVPGNVGFQYGGKVLGLDVNAHQGDHQAALFEGDKWYKINDKGERTVL